MRKLKHVKLFENFLINEGNMRGGGPEKVLYIYGNAEENAIGKKVMHSETSYYYKYVNDNTDTEFLDRMKNLVNKGFEEKGKSARVSNAKALDCFTNTHNGSVLFVRFLDNNMPIRTGDDGIFSVDGWIVPALYGESQYKFGPGTTKGFIDESELDLLIMNQDIKDVNGLKKALYELKYNVVDITSKGIITTKDQ